TRVPGGGLAAAGLLVMGLLPPRVAGGLLLGTWLGGAGFGRGRQEAPVLLERLEWRKQLQDAMTVELIVLTGLVYVFRERARAPSGWVLATAFLLVCGSLFSYFYTIGPRIAPRLRAVHGYAVGLVAFLPWAYPLARWSWTAFGLGLASFLIFPAFFLIVFDRRPDLRTRRWRRLGRVSKKRFRPGRGRFRPAGLGRW
ncbi:MAG: hypothetical protein GX493_12550, partial [Firmicutes bacterium]|nr:hypothetical protein [Bacillota bacterium]